MKIIILFLMYIASSQIVFSSSMTWVITDKCDDDKPIIYRFHSADRNVAWGHFYAFGYNNPIENNLACNEGENICFGADFTDTRHWGVGFDGTKDCSNCCAKCDGKRYQYNPSCNPDDIPPPVITNPGPIVVTPPPPDIPPPAVDNNTLRSTQVWDDSIYLQRNLDVKTAVENGGFISGFHHYITHGKAEGRASGLISESEYTSINQHDKEYLEILYLLGNKDILNAVIQNNLADGKSHYINHGSYENRIATEDAVEGLFDESYYLNRYPDVANAVSAGTIEPYEHFLLHGQQEGRIASESTLNIIGYINDTNTNYQQEYGMPFTSFMSGFIPGFTSKTLRKTLTKGVKSGLIKGSLKALSAVSLGEKLARFHKDMINVYANSDKFQSAEEIDNYFNRRSLEFVGELVGGLVGIQLPQNYSSNLLVAYGLSNISTDDITGGEDDNTNNGDDSTNGGQGSCNALALRQQWRQGREQCTATWEAGLEQCRRSTPGIEVFDCQRPVYREWDQCIDDTDKLLKKWKEVYSSNACRHLWGSGL